MTLGRLCLALSLGLVAGLLPPATSTADQHRPARIAFTRFDPQAETFSLWTARPDGSDRERVVADAFFPAWSPNRRRLLFDFTDGQGDQQVAVVRRDGKRLRLLTDLPGISEAADFSPDGGAIVFDRSPLSPLDPEFFTSIWVMGPDGSDPHPLFEPDPAKFDVEPEFSPDGERIVFARLRISSGGAGFEGAVFVVDSDGTNERQVTRYRGFLEHPRWAPGGRSIVFDITHARLGHRADGIYRVRADGTRLRRILAGTLRLSAFMPDFSPSGRRILFACHVAASEQDDLCAMNADGSNVERVTRTPRVYENFPVWD